MSETQVPDLDEGVVRLMKRGSELLKNKKHGEAVKFLSDALKIATEPQHKADTLLCRSQAFTEMSAWLRSIPAKDSESNAILGLDPTALAQLGLKDAKKALAMAPQLVEAYCRKSEAELLLEQYQEAKETYLEGLSIDPINESLQSGLRRVQQHLEGSRPSSPAPVAAAYVGSKRNVALESAAKADLISYSRRRANTDAADDAECGLCMKLLFEPVTTPCGHSFCRQCFKRATDHSSKCPMCRTVLHVGQDIPVTLQLRQLIQKCFPEEYETRRQEEQAAAAGTADGREGPLPLFVMSCCLPNEKMSLNIFEPRYRLMIRRCMQGNRRFAMGSLSSGHQLNSVACEVEITELDPLQDGRYLLDIVGRRRFTIERDWEQDGYRMVQPVFFSDNPPAAGSPEAEELASVAAEVLERTNSLVSQFRSSALARGILSGQRAAVMELLGRAGERPPQDDYEQFSFWVANLLPLDQHIRLRLLSMKTTLERLKEERGMLSSNVRTCGIM